VLFDVGGEEGLDVGEAVLSYVAFKLGDALRVVVGAFFDGESLNFLPGGDVAGI